MARISATRAWVAGSTLTVTLPAETCTAGASPNRLGSVYSAPTNKAITMIAYFQTGYRFMIAPEAGGAVRVCARCRPRDSRNYLRVPLGSTCTTALRCSCTSTFSAISMLM